jgi:hypothetical protein
VVAVRQGLQRLIQAFTGHLCSSDEGYLSLLPVPRSHCEVAVVNDSLALVAAPERAGLLAVLEAIAEQARAFVDATRAPNTVRACAAD